LASYPALDLRWAAGPGAGTFQDFLYAELDSFEPVAIHEHETGDSWRVFFRTSAQRDAARAALSAEFGNALLELSSIDVDDEDWARRSQAGLRAVTVGRIVVAPPWDVPLIRDPLPVDEEFVVIITPSMGFGTGHHATTRLCLALLQEIDVLGRRVIDVGTGSGVLAIAAAMLGAAAVVAVDNDPDAIQSARDNVSANDVGQVVDVRLADLATLDDRADVLLANLTGATLAAHVDRLQQLATPGATAILSGFEPDESHAIAAAWMGWSVRHRKREGDWAAVCLIERASLSRDLPPIRR
jgi:ribosomal protein L11 methyltransferase